MKLPAPVFEVPPTLVVPGTRLVLKGVYVFQCPLCKKLFHHDDPYEPMCTGPSETRHEHAPEVMRFVRREERRVMI